MLEVNSGVYVAPNLSDAVRRKIWDILAMWWATLGNGSIVMVWRDHNAVGRLRIQNIGESPKEIIDADGILLVKRN